MRNLLLLTALLLASAASAQVQVRLQLATNAQDTLGFGPKDCSDRPVRITWAKSGTACEQLNLWFTATDCGDTPNTQQGDVTLDPVPKAVLQDQAATTGTFEVNLSQLPYPIADGGTCGDLRQDKTFKLCGATKSITSIFDTTCSSNWTRSSAVKFIYDGTPPAAPTIESAEGLDESALVRMSEPSGSTRLDLVVSRDGGEVKTVRQVVGKGPTRVEGLENGVTYQLVAYALDDAENQSEPSGAVDVTPINTTGFFEAYVNGGGKEAGGCGATGGGIAGGAVLAVLGFWLFSRRNRSWLEQ